MKIQSINPFINRVVSNKVNTNQFYKLNSIPYDTVSFSARPAETVNIVNARIRAEEIQKQAEEIKIQGEEYAIEGYDVLDETKNTFMQALKYIDMARVSAGNDTASFELSDGRSLTFVSIIKDGKPKPLMIQVYDKDNKNTHKIIVEDYVPKHIEEYNSDGTIRSTDFNLNSIIVMDDVNPTEGNKIGTLYVYDGGLLMAVRKNRNLTSRPMVDEKSFYYNEKGDLWIAEENTQMELIGKRVVENRYNFVNGKLYNYYTDFTKSPEDLLGWSESYHYDQYKFVGKTENAQQFAKDKPAIAETSIFMQNRKFVEAEDVNCKINDYAVVAFSENLN